MGCGSSSLAEPSSPAIDWARYEPTGDTSTDARHAQELCDLAKRYFTNNDLVQRCLLAARRLDPNNADIAGKLAVHYENVALFGDESRKLQNYSKAEELFSESYRLANGRMPQGHFHSWANVVVAQGSHRQSDYDHILRLTPRDYKDLAKDANTARSEARFHDAVTLYTSAYDGSQLTQYLVNAVHCSISLHGLASLEVRAAAGSALRKVSAVDEAYREWDQEKFLSKVIKASPLFETAQVREKRGDVSAAIEAGHAAFWALQHPQIAEFQHRLLTEAGRIKDCERMLDLYWRDSPSAKDRRLVPLYLGQERYMKAHTLLTDIYKELPGGPERDSLVEIDRQCMELRKAAVEAATSAIDTTPADGHALSKAALFFYFEKEYELSVRALQRAIAIEPEVGQHYGDLADSIYALSSYALDRRHEAEDYYKKALALDSTSLQRLIWSVRTGMDPKTAAYFIDNLKWDPHAEYFAWFGSTFKYGTTFEGSTKAWDAIEAYETALALQPDHPQASQWRERLKYIEGLVEKVRTEQEMRRLHGDPVSRRLLGLQNYQSFGYGVSGSWNQFNTAYWQAQVPY